MNQPPSAAAFGLCKTPEFQHFAGCQDEPSTVEWLRKRLGIESRSELDKNPAKAREFDNLVSAYRRSLL